MVVPDLTKLSASVIKGALTSSSLVETRARTTKERKLAKLLCQNTLDIREGVGGGVGWANASIGEPVPGGYLTEVVDDSLEELEEVSVLGSLRTL